MTRSGCKVSEARVRVQLMRQLVNVNPTSEHALYLRLFVTNGGGW